MAVFQALVRDIPNEIKLSIKQLHLNMEISGKVISLNDLYLLLFKKGIETINKELQEEQTDTDKAA